MRDVGHVKAQRSCEPRHQSNIWKCTKRKGRLRSPAFIDSRPAAKAAFACCVLERTWFPGVEVPLSPVSTHYQTKVQPGPLRFCLSLGRVTMKPVEMRTLSQPRDALPDSQKATSDHSGNFRLKIHSWAGCRSIGKWRASCFRNRRERQHANARGIYRKRTAPRRPHPRNESSGNERHSLAPPAVVSQKRLPIPGQCSRRGRCCSGCTPVRLQALEPIQGGGSDVDVANLHCYQLCTDAIAQTATPDPNVAG